MTPTERELLLELTDFAVNFRLWPGKEERFKALAQSVRAAAPNPVETPPCRIQIVDTFHAKSDPDMEPPKAPPTLGFAFDGPGLRIVADNYGLDLRPKESDADLRVRVLDAIARSASAPQGAPQQLSRYVVRYDETQTFQTTALAWSPEEAVRDIQAKIDAGNSLGGRDVDGAGPHNVRVVL